MPRTALGNGAKLVRRRQRLHGKIVATRKLYLHELTRRLAAGFDVVCIEDLELSGMARRKAMRLGKSVSDAALGEIVRQLDYKTTTSGVASIRGETQNGDPRTGETESARQRAGGHGPSEDATDPASPPRAGSREVTAV